MKLTIPSMGEVKLHLIEEENGTWEEDWEPLRGTAYGDLCSRMPKDDLNKGLFGYTRPVMDRLGITPMGALRKIPDMSKTCFKRKTCPFYDDKTCFTEAEKMPWCYEPDGVLDERIRLSATRAIEQWRSRTYLVVIYDE